ncbi:hydrolase [Mycolicibacterium flavescens]|uniref:alpha/beta fold hydrolase n=1 Tax=Mycobacterium neumannii TaxID=2048551 RepID=UPI000B945D19|nr:alpha/beta fold hydrolase [Mycobacterium neumannii]VEG47118.1 hydrolase [Mycolicibacterium flavescens]
MKVPDSESNRSPLVCIHGFSGSWRNWLPVIPMLESHYEVHNLPLAGHADGPRLRTGEKATVTILADHLERALDDRGVGTAHLLGNSLGGWLALELAARGRGLSVTALSPAMGWAPARSHMRTLKLKLVMARRLFAAMAPIAPQALRLRPIRRLALGAAVAHTDRMRPQDAAAFVQDNLRCEIYFELMGDILAGRHELGPISCPVQIAWSERDALIPYEPYGARFPEVLPDAHFVTLPDVGHVPMYDDTRLVARTVLDFAGPVDGAQGAFPVPGRSSDVN